MQENNSRLSSYLQERSENYSKSPYGKKVLKVRSTSTLKEQSKGNKPVVSSPPLKHKTLSNIPGKFSLNNSFINTKKDPDTKVSSNKRQFKHTSNESEVNEIGSRLQEIVSKHKENGIDFEIFENYLKIFDEIIEKDKIFGKFLEKIKFAFQEWVSCKIISFKEVKKLKSEVFEFSKRLTEEIEENKQLHRKVQKFSRENVDLGRALDEKDNSFRTLQEYLLKVTNLSIDEIPLDSMSWKVLVSENKSYSELCNKLKNKIRNLKKKETRLMTLFWNLKQKGYPVEKVYDNIQDTEGCEGKYFQGKIGDRSRRKKKEIKGLENLEVSVEGYEKSFFEKAAKVTRRSTKRCGCENKL
jgi:hypothetical protein